MATKSTITSTQAHAPTQWEGPPAMPTVIARKVKPARRSYALYEYDSPAVYELWLDGVKLGTTQARRSRYGAAWRLVAASGQIVLFADSLDALRAQALAHFGAILAKVRS